MDLQALTIFVEIVDGGNFSQAARTLNMSRANVSYHIGQLEKSLDAELLRRTPQGVELTNIGQQVYQHAKSIVHASALMREAVSANESEERLIGKIGLSAPTGFGQLVMGPWLIEFKKKYPGIILDVRLENFIDNLVKDGVDVAIRVTPEPPPMVVARDLGPVHYTLCASSEWVSQNHLPQSTTELRHTPIITSGGVSGRVHMIATQNNQEEEIDFVPTLMSRSYPFVLDCILSGIGVGLVPDYVILPHLQTGKVVQILPEYQFSIDRNHIYMMYMPNRYQTRATTLFIDFLTDKMGILRTLRKSHF
ncbi:LysR family transcriptional regulator [Comamonas jiangduensis]|jgi:DNA-binding transcriptional LysR family regulator|uniref:LysR family transcriptional regulator n=1 Tax=Comamonas jiangduensis TaxID=1194168 RepID=UPI0028A5A848|nr:LysR family transcriptional regulator [Comamonas jiangduensis]